LRFLIIILLCIKNHRLVAIESKIILEGVLSKEKDVDYSVLVTELSAQMVALEAVQSSFAKIAQMSLLDYIR